MGVVNSQRLFCSRKYDITCWYQCFLLLNLFSIFRRDGIPATVKILEKSIRILFETKDISQVISHLL